MHARKVGVLAAARPVPRVPAPDAAAGKYYELSSKCHAAENSVEESTNPCWMQLASNRVCIETPKFQARNSLYKKLTRLESSGSYVTHGNGTATLQAGHLQGVRYAGLRWPPMRNEVRKLCDSWDKTEEQAPIRTVPVDKMRCTTHSGRQIQSWHSNRNRLGLPDYCRATDRMRSLTHLCQWCQLCSSLPLVEAFLLKMFVLASEPAAHKPSESTSRSAEQGQTNRLLESHVSHDRHLDQSPTPNP